MRVALSFWIACAAYVVFMTVTAISLVTQGPDSWSGHLANPVHVMGLLPPVVASGVALVLRRRRTIIQLIAASLAFLVVAPVTSLAVERVRVASESRDPYEGFYADSVVFPLVYLQIPLLIVVLIAVAGISCVLTVRRQLHHASA